MTDPDFVRLRHELVLAANTPNFKPHGPICIVSDPEAEEKLAILGLFQLAAEDKEPGRHFLDRLVHGRDRLESRRLQPLQQAIGIDDGIVD